jgi:phosphoribosylglycinamide formyltransferase 1
LEKSSPGIRAVRELLSMARDMAASGRPIPHHRRRIRTAVLASGNGSNLDAVVAAAREEILPLELRLVVSNNAQAFALERAAKAGIPTAVLEFNKHVENRSDYARRLASVLQTSGASLILLLGWMHVLAPEFLNAGFDGILNLHPAYLPEDPSADVVVFPDGTETAVFRGAHALRDALAARVPYTGATLIQITSQVDRGPVLARKPMSLSPHEDETIALGRLHEVEREVVREGILRWIGQRRLA